VRADAWDTYLSPVKLDEQAKANMLDQLGAIAKLTAHSGDLEELARQKRNEADSLNAQATVAKTERDRLAGIAQTAFVAA
ncbi:hypothetical protein ACC691_40990, partial [Rhizobium johnstonii]|uniref:hypothetical protein n=1 Tax=Rhizobium johnstonii TaxID=3019933 RepID=UPI003F98802D